MTRWWEELVFALTGRRDRHETLPDLRGLPSRSVRLERTHYLVNDRERRDQSGRLYVLRRDRPRAGRSASNVAVYSNGRAVGYLPDAVASTVARHLDALGGAAVVNGSGAEAASIRLRVDVPLPGALAAFASSHVRPALGDPRERVVR